MSLRCVFVLLALGCLPARGADGPPLAGTKPLTVNGNFSSRMLDGIEKYLLRETTASVEARKALWKRDFSSPEAYEKSVAPNRERFQRIIGVVDTRLPVTELEYVGGTASPAEVARTQLYSIHAVRWPVLEGVDGEGLLLRPTGKPRACIVALPDADQTPEMLAGLAPGIPAEGQFARRLAENGCLVVVPMLIDRRDTHSGNPKFWMTNQPHREWVYRPAFELGRHIIGYEVQKVLALVDWFGNARETKGRPIGVAGYGEGGLLALYSAAVDRRIGGAMVSGYFDSRQHLWEEPIYRNVFGLLREFGDAEIASLVAPRPLVIEYSEVPKVNGPPAPEKGRRPYAAPGKLRTPSLEVIKAEVERAKKLCPRQGGFQPVFTLCAGESGKTIGPGSERAVVAFVRSLGRPLQCLGSLEPPPTDARAKFDPDARQHR